MSNTPVRHPVVLEEGEEEEDIMEPLPRQDFVEVDADDDDNKNNNNADAEACMVCYHDMGAAMMSKRKSVHGMIWCGHVNICKSCFHRCDKCPVCRAKYHNHEDIMTMAEETRLVQRMRKLKTQRESAEEKVEFFQQKRARYHNEYNQLVAVKERQRLLLKRRVQQLDS
jgi:hypothetical protein